MNILIPMAGAGQRFADSGYKIHKPALPTIYRNDGKEYPMVVCAVKDLPGILSQGSNVIFIDRDFHKTDGIENKIQAHYPKAQFITVDQLTEGQACTCLLAKEKINNDEELLIAGCDNGMAADFEQFYQLTKRCDALVFTYRNNWSVMANPDAYGWVKADENGAITDLSIKKAISENPVADHAIVATFWFRKGSMFVEAAEKMIAENDRVNGEFYVDEAIKHMLALGYDTRIFEIERYIGWGTPADYENYTHTLHYWERFVADKRFLAGD